MKRFQEIPQVELVPSEDRDWDFARTRRILLRTPLSEFSSSTFSVKVNLSQDADFVVPNRDFVNEGFTFLNRGEPWKILDGIGISLSSAGRSLDLASGKVVFSPLRASYHYSVDQEHEVVADYSLSDDGELNASSLNLELAIPSSLMGSSLQAYLLLDPRSLRRDSSRPIIDPSMENGFLSRSGNLHVSVVSDGRLDTSQTKVRELNWIYKLGFGFRHETPDGIRFIPHLSGLSVVGPYNFTLRKDRLTLRAIASLDFPLDSEATEKMMNAVKQNETNVSWLLSLLPFEQIEPKVRNALYGRICSMLLFGIRVNLDGKRFIAGEAGAWWFRQSWMRDVYEGLLWNQRTLMILGLQHYIAAQLHLGLRFADQFGLIPNLIAWQADNPMTSYDSLDSTLLLHQLLMEYSSTTGDLEMLRSGMSLLFHFMQSLQKDQIPDIKQRNGSLLCPPNYSWVDSKMDVELDGVRITRAPTRLPLDFYGYIRQRGVDLQRIHEIVEGPNFILPEIQSRWVRVLAEASRISRDLGLESGVLERTLSEAKEAFEEHFLAGSKDLPPNFVFLADDEHWTDWTPSSTSLISIAILKGILAPEHLERAYGKARSELVVYRKLIELDAGREAPFGLLTQKRDCRPYLGDEQYHGCVVWPRDTPYLFELMTSLGVEEEIDLLLLNNLDASISECVPFYCNELYGLPLGGNPSAEERTRSQPIPLKNPAQWWSNWVDPYLRWSLT